MSVTITNFGSLSFHMQMIYKPKDFFFYCSIGSDGHELNVNILKNIFLPYKISDVYTTYKKLKSDRFVGCNDENRIVSRTKCHWG